MVVSWPAPPYHAPTYDTLYRHVRHAVPQDLEKELDIINAATAMHRLAKLSRKTEARPPVPLYSHHSYPGPSPRGAPTHNLHLETPTPTRVQRGRL